MLDEAGGQSGGGYQIISTRRTCSISERDAALARAFAFPILAFFDLNSLRASMDDNSDAGVLSVLRLEGDSLSDVLEMVGMESVLSSELS